MVRSYVIVDNDDTKTAIQDGGRGQLHRTREVWFTGNRSVYRMNICLAAEHENDHFQ